MGFKLFSKLPNLFKDHQSKKLLSGQAIVLLVEAQLRQRDSLEEIADNLDTNKDLQKYIQLDSIHAPAIIRKLEHLPTEYLKEQYQAIISKIGKICFEVYFI